MTIPFWLRGMIQSTGPTPSSPRPAASRSRKRSPGLSLERLEDRRLLTTFTVLNGLDSCEGSLRAAIVAANNEVANPGPDTIDFAANVTQVTLTTEQLSLTSDVTIAGPAGGVTIARSAAGGTPEFRIFEVPAGATATLENLTITGGRAVDGGGIANSGTVTVTDSTLSGNSAVAGGGIRNNFGTVTVTASTLSGNSAGAGGGIRNFGTATVTGSTLSGNSAGAGGGIRNFGAVTVTASTLSGNSASSGGDKLGESARIIGAVNCVVAHGDSFVGENTGDQHMQRLQTDTLIKQFLEVQSDFGKIGPVDTAGRSTSPCGLPTPPTIARWARRFQTGMGASAMATGSIS